MQRQSARAAVPCWLPSFLLCMFSFIGCHAQSSGVLINNYLSVAFRPVSKPDSLPRHDSC